MMEFCNRLNFIASAFNIRPTLFNKLNRLPRLIARASSADWEKNIRSPNQCFSESFDKFAKDFIEAADTCFDAALLENIETRKFQSLHKREFVKRTVKTA
ncbi:hypothetical protein [Methylomonas methanica]|uniref:hypothetical protein n=1 Tax=Methylomonas methanica TaxID=421 RepID=UPI00059C19E9|nr:hypothetical protein [Methylomonas methanica]